MSAQALISIIQSPISFNRLRAIIKLNDNKTFSKKDLYTEAKQLGLKPFEFYQIIKMVKNPELLMNQLAFLELINDNLLDE